MFQAANTQFHSDILVLYVIFNKKKVLLYFIHLLDLDMTDNRGYILLLNSRFFTIKQSCI